MTLIELIIVLALIATLMALSLPMLSNANAEARSVACQQNLADMGGAISSYVRDSGKLPSLTQLPPHELGTSLPELVAPRLQCPNVLYCPSDETQESHLLATSYYWEATSNGMRVDELDRIVGQPLLTDREPFHADTELAVNGLVLRRSSYGRYSMDVIGGADEDPSGNDPGDDRDQGRDDKGNDGSDTAEGGGGSGIGSWPLSPGKHRPPGLDNNPNANPKRWREQ